ANFSKQYGWGTVTLGGNRGQELSSGVVTLTLPTVSVSPAPVNLSPSITWSPSFNFSNDRTSHQFAGTLSRPPELGIPRTDSLFATTENTSMQIGTPFRFGRWSIPLNGSVAHSYNDRRSSVSFPDPADSSRTITRFYGEDFNTALDWNTQLSLPTLFSSTWKLQPSVGIQNSTGGAFALRNRNSGGAFVTQGKRLSFAASISPALFGFFPGIGPLSRIRHSVSPSLTWSYAPPAKVPEAYARALDPTGRSPQRQSPRSQLISLGLSQTFEGKFRQPPEDSSSGAQARKIKLLSIQTTQIQYNFEQAKLPGRNGWTTQQLSNQLSSDLLPGFSLAMSHDLWDGPVGYDSIRFSPFLTNVSARFTISGATVRGLAGLLTGRRDARSAASLPQDADTTMRGVPQRLGGPVGTGLGGLNRLGTVPPTTARRQFMATVDFEDQRQRPDTTRVGQTGNRSVIMGFAFSPTPGWSVTWNTQYNITAGEFGQHDLRLERDLRRWHATFAFVKTPNGNFGFNFFITLLDQQAIKFQYDQRTVNR
ncbi:MAG: hypothetical protein HY700_02990, partial [Gemmatimonadetes bacterium]|nr:hypothetical protein [Gemmatimonadota bacterium]